MNLKSKQVTRFKKKNGVYVRGVWVKKTQEVKPSPFQRQGR